MRRKFLSFGLGLSALLAMPQSADAAESGGADGLVALRPLGAPIVENGRVSGQLRVVLKIVPQSEDAATEISARAQAWQSKLLAALNEFARLNVSVYRPVDAAKLKAALLAALKDGGAGAKDIILIDIVAY